MNIVEQAENAAEFINDRTHEQYLDKLLWMLRTRRDEAPLYNWPSHMKCDRLSMWVTVRPWNATPI